MIRRIVQWSLRAPRLVAGAAIVVLVFGVVQLRDAKVDVLPEFSPTTVEVQTPALGLSAEEVEQLITVPLEQDLLDGVAWLDKIQSKSVPGLSSVTMTFAPGTDMYRARQVVQERISQAAGLPNVSQPPQMVQPRSSTARVTMVALSSDRLTPLEIGVLARWTIRPRLLAVPGVANVAIWGQRERQLQVQVDPEELESNNVTLEQLIATTGNALWVSPLTFLEASTPGTGGFIDTPNQRLGIQHNLPIVNASDLSKVAISEAKNGLTIGDVATVVEDHQPLIGDAVAPGAAAGRESTMLVIEKRPNANTAEVAQGIESALDELRPGLDGLTLDTSIYRPASYIHRAQHNLSRSTILSLVLLVLAMFTLLLRWRAALIALVSVVLSFTAGAVALHLLGTTFNAFVFAGLVVALAAIVDDAITNVDQTCRRMREQGAPIDNGGRASLIVAITNGASATGRTLVWATVVYAVALAPIFLMDGLSGDAFFPPAAAAGLVALVASVVVATTVAPALSALLLTREAVTSRALAGRVERGYAHALGGFATNPVPVLVVVAAVVVPAVFLAPRFHKTLLPPFRDPNLLVRWDAPFGTSLPEMNRVTERAAAELSMLPGVRDVGGHVGQGLLGDQPVGADSAEMWVRLDPSANYDRAVASVKAVVASYPGLRHEVLTYSEQRTREVLHRERHPITVRLFGADLGVLHNKAEEIKSLLAKTDGIRNATVTTRAAEPTVEVEVDLPKARKAGIKPGDVRRAAATLLSGLRVGSLFEQQKVFDVVVWAKPEARRSVSSVRDLLINTPEGDTVRLGDVANVRVRPTLPIIEHEDISRFVDITADVSGRDLHAVVGSVKHQLAQVDFPREYHATLLDDYAKQHDAQQRLVWFAIAAAVLVFLLFQAAFGSWRLAVVAFITLPIALAGGVFAARIDGGPMTIATVAGLLTVLALVVRQTMALLATYQRLRADNAISLSSTLVVRGASERVMPVVTSVMTTALVILPLLVYGAIAGQELVHPMAVVVLGGLVTASAASLFVLPALYLHLAPRRDTAPLHLDIDLVEAEHEPRDVPVGD